MARATLPTLADRTAGVLLHITSLAGRHGSGDLGPGARAFVEWAAQAKLSWWQMLPVGPAGYGNSPYSALSSFAGNPLLLSLEALAAGGLLAADEAPAQPGGRIDWGRTQAARGRALRAAFERFRARPLRARARFEAFQVAEKRWLDDWTLYAALKAAHGGGSWVEWPEPLRARRRAALGEARRRFADDLAFHGFCQWLFHEQWRALRAHAHEHGVALVGDVPIFVAHDSADVWAHPELFRLDARGQPTHIAGVPPDYFSATGQRWGNPLYRWSRHRASGYRWWIDRMASTLQRFDAVRIDHFIGFQRYWEIPASEPTAVKGRWLPGPGAHFFRAVRRKLGALPLVAEDLGAITPEVKALRDAFALPGIRLLQFAFGTDPSAPDFVPHAYPRRAVVYTGTHDNDTTLGWYAAAPETERAAARAYLGVTGDHIHWDMIRAVHMSVADLAIVPMQDLLGLGNEARMNLPGTPAGNWEWRMEPGAPSAALAARVGEMIQIYGRDREDR
jgi:4-alpha-glucanotransferase